MMRGFIVVITAGMAKFFLGRPQYFHHYISLICIVGAVALVGLVGILHTDDSGDTGEATTTTFGITLLIISQLFAGSLMISEEKLLSGYYLDPLMVVGLEGFWGLMYYSILLPIF